MTYQLDVLPDLGGSDITVINQYLDDYLNTQIFYAVLHGLYSRLGLYCSSPICHHT